MCLWLGIFFGIQESDNKLRTAPDVMIAFGRPKGHRGSYRQWEEGGVAPQFVMEVLSQGNRVGEMTRKGTFYAAHGVEEYVIFDPDKGSLEILVRDGSDWDSVEEPNGWRSKLTDVTFFVDGKELIAVSPTGEKFETYVEIRHKLDGEAKLRLEAEARIRQLLAQLEAAGLEPQS
jgi:Uma2 family endonuclease